MADGESPDPTPVLAPAVQREVWRAWRTTNDEAWAAKLFELVGEGPVAELARRLSTGSGALATGALAGFAGWLAGEAAAGWLQVGPAIHATAALLAGLGAAVLGAWAGARRVRRMLAWPAPPGPGAARWRSWLRLHGELLPMGLGALLLGALPLAGLLFGVEGEGRDAILGAASFAALIASFLLVFAPPHNEISEEEARARSAWWWRRSPDPSSLVPALERDGGEPFDELRRSVEESRTWSAEQRLAALLEGDGPRALAGFHALASDPRPRDGAVLHRLGEAARDRKASRRGEAALAAVRIADRCREAIDHSDGVVCATCLVRYVDHRASLGRGRSITWSGCGICEGSGARHENVEEIVAVVDRTAPAEPRVRDGRLEIDARSRRGPFEFDRISLVDATDAEAEELALRVENDPELARRGRCSRATVEIGPGCTLRPNTLRILERTFGEVRSPARPELGSSTGSADERRRGRGDRELA